MLAGKLHWGEGKKKTQKGFARGFFGFSLVFFLMIHVISRFLG